MAYDPGTDVIVVNYKTPGDLRDFGQSYLASHPDDAHLWVCNVQPTREDQIAADEIADALPGSAVSATSFADNVGYSGSVNHAASKGNKEIIAIFNADVVLSPGSLSECAATLQGGNPDWAILGPRQTDKQHRIVHGGIMGTRQAPALRGWGQLDREQYTEVEQAVSVSGSAYFIKRSVWNELTDCPLYQQAAPGALGAFLPTRHYYEETFCSYHAIEHGWQVVYFGPVTITHKFHRASALDAVDRRVASESQKIFRAACKVHSIPCN